MRSLSLVSSILSLPSELIKPIIFIPKIVSIADEGILQKGWERLESFRF